MSTLHLGIATRYGYIQQQDLYTLSCDSFLYIERRLVVKKKNNQMSTTLRNNCMAFMFNKIRYELNSIDIDRNANIRTIKKYVLVMYDKSLITLSAGWNFRHEGRLLQFLRAIGLLRGLQTRGHQCSPRIFGYERATITIAWWEIL